MANWLSVKSAAEKYGISEEVILEGIRLRYLSCSSFHKEPFEDDNPMVNIDEIDDFLRFNAAEPHPDDATMERIPKKQLSWLYQEIERLEKENKDLMKYNKKTQ